MFLVVYVGDEYLGKSKKFGYWRDTHLRIVGDASECIAITYLSNIGIHS